MGWSEVRKWTASRNEEWERLIFPKEIEKWKEYIGTGEKRKGRLRYDRGWQKVSKIDRRWRDENELGLK